ncbi:MAG: FecR domain-containing protein [Armatimonadetes bacterium]|nr:FecR domain-containing protein [Armatimonadota bacterium]
MQRAARAAFVPDVLFLALALLSTHSIAPAAIGQTSGGVAATVTAIEGQAEVIAPGGGAATAARVGLRVPPGSTVRTKAGGRVELQFDDRSLLRLDQNTEVTILSGPQERGVMVTLGNIWAKVQSVFGASKFKVKTPTVVAGVRGTILRAEVTAEEAEIAVDEGEVEVAPVEGGGQVIVGASERVRARRGVRDLRPDRFDPAARNDWEFWTDPLVQREIEDLKAAAAASQQTCEGVARRTKEVHEALALDTQAAWRLSVRVSSAGKLLGAVRRALGEAPPPPRPPGPPVRPGGALPPPAKAQLLVWLETAAGAYTQAAPLVARGREAMTQHVEDVEALRQAMAAQQAAERALSEGLSAFRHRREVDPHWQTFRGPCEESESHKARIAQQLGECRPMLAPEVPDQLGDDLRQLKTIQHQFAWGLKVLDALDQQITTGQSEVARLRELVAALPDAP